MWEGKAASAEAQGFCDLWGVDGTVLLDEDGSVAEKLGVRGVPANVFVDSDGTVTAVGAATPGELVAETRRLLGPLAPEDLATLDTTETTPPLENNDRIEQHFTAWASRVGDGSEPAP